MLLDDRINQLAEKVLKYSLNLKKGNRGGAFLLF